METTFIDVNEKIIHKENCNDIFCPVGSLCDFSRTIYEVLEIRVDHVKNIAIVIIQKYWNQEV